MLRALCILLATASVLSAAPLWEGNPGSYRITGDPAKGKGTITAKDGVL